MLESLKEFSIKINGVMDEKVRFVLEKQLKNTVLE